MGIPPSDELLKEWAEKEAQEKAAKAAAEAVDQPKTEEEKPAVAETKAE